MLSRFLPHWKHKNLVLFVLGLGVMLFFLRLPAFHQALLSLGTFGYLGGFVAGTLFVSTFTVATGALILLNLAKILSPTELIPVAIMGAVLGDFLIFRFVRQSVNEQIAPIYEKIEGSHFKKILHTRYFAWTLPVLGALIIISPFPDELGISLLGISAIQTTRFLLISAFSHAVGMSLIFFASSFI